MIIDAHVHIKLEGHKDKSVEHLLKAMDEARIDMSAVFAAAIDDVRTKEVLKSIKPYRDRLFAVGAVSPFNPRFQPSLEKVDDWLGEGKIRALKFYTGYEHFYPKDRRIRPYLKLLVKHGRPAIFHCGDLYSKHPDALLEYAHPLKIDRLAVAMPDLRIIIAHVGNPWFTDAAQVCYKNKNVYADCSGFVYGKFEPRREEFFARLWNDFDLVSESEGKMLFGTDWPISDQADYVRVVGKLAGAQRERVFSANAKALFGL